MRGNVLVQARSNAFDWFVLFGGSGHGTLYLVAKIVETIGADVSHAAAITVPFPPTLVFESAGGTARV